MEKFIILFWHHLRGFFFPLSCFGWSFGSGCRADASEAAIILLPSNITVFTLDFSGSGLSGGEHVTLGWNEVSRWLFYLSSSGFWHHCWCCLCISFPPFYYKSGFFARFFLQCLQIWRWHKWIMQLNIILFKKIWGLISWLKHVLLYFLFLKKMFCFIFYFHSPSLFVAC